MATHCSLYYVPSLVTYTYLPVLHPFSFRTKGTEARKRALHRALLNLFPTLALSLVFRIVSRNDPSPNYFMYQICLVASHRLSQCLHHIRGVFSKLFLGKLKSLLVGLIISMLSSPPTCKATSSRALLPLFLFHPLTQSLPMVALSLHSTCI